MVNRLVFVVSLAAAAAACDPGAFDDRRGQAWSDSNGPTGISSADYGASVLGITTDTPGATIAVLGQAPAAIGVVSYDATGQLTLTGGDLDLPALGEPPTIATAPQPLPGAPSLVAVGGLGAVDEIQFFDVSSGAPLLAATLSGADCGAPGQDLGRFMAFGFTSAGLPRLLDFVTVRGDEMIIIPDIDLNDLPTDASGCLRCELSGMGVSGAPVAMGLIDFNPPADDDGAALEEIFIAGSGVVTAFDAFQIQEASEASAGCFEIRTPQISNLTLVGAGADLGTAWAAGNADELETPELALWSPSAEAVFVIPNFSSSGPGGVVPPLTAAGASPEFGTSMVFADIDGDDFDELAIGDPGASPEGVPGAGAVTIFEASLTELEYSQRTQLFDSEPEAGQRYGRSVDAVEFVFGEDDADILAAGANDEVFTIFRTLAESTDPRQ